MVLDTSAILAILLNEPEINAFSAAIERDPVRLLSAASLVETSLVVESRHGEAGRRDLDLLLQTAEIEIAPLDARQADMARHAFRTFGKGRHAAALNLGDCFSYALAQVSGEALLFKGNDFSKTNVRWVPLAQE
jgi:ribonuclease VapC